MQKRSPNNLKNRPETSAKGMRNSTCQTSPHVTLFMSVLGLSLGKSRPVVGRCHSSLSGCHRPECSASCSCRPAHRQCKARAAELSGNVCAAPDCSCIAPRSPGRSPSVCPCRHVPARPIRYLPTAGVISRSGPRQMPSVSRSIAFCLRQSWNSASSSCFRHELDYQQENKMFWLLSVFKGCMCHSSVSLQTSSKRLPSKRSAKALHKTATASS